MKRQILKYILSPVISFFLLIGIVGAQEKKMTEAKKEPLYRGAYVSADIYGLGSRLFGSDFLSSEVNVSVSLKNQFFPVVEIGYGTTNTTDQDNGIHYKSSAPYYRIGLNYNTMSKKKSKSFLYAGLRYGFTSLSYDVDATLRDPIWNDESPFTYNNQKSNISWFEVLLGVNVQIYKNFHMGWAIRYKSRISVKKNPNTTPWYIPGYGSNKSSNLGITYSLIYKLPF